MTSLMMISVTGGLGQPLTCDMDQRSYFILLLIIRVIVNVINITVVVITVVVIVINIILIVVVIIVVVIVIRMIMIARSPAGGVSL